MATATTLPPALDRGLKRLGARLRRRRVARGAGTLLLGLAVATLAAMAADVLLPLPDALRWAIWLAIVGGVVVVSIRNILIPLFSRVGTTDLAAVASRAHPGLGERLTAAVALRADEAAGRAHGSPELIAELADRAAASLGALDLGGSVPGRPATGRLAAGLAAAALVVGPVVARPDPFADLARRVLAPWRDVERVGRYVVVVRQGDRVVARGEDVALSAEVRPRFGTAPATSAELSWTDAGGRAQRAPMVADPTSTRGTRTWRLTRPRVDASFTYRVRSGSIASAAHRITAIERPAVSALTATVAPPAYTGRPAAASADAARIDALDGSAVTLRLAASRPVRRAVVRWPAPAPAPASAETAGEPAPIEVAATPADREGRAWSVTLPARASGRFEIALRDEHEIAGAPGPERYVAVLPDAPPTVAWTGAAAGLTEARADDLVPGGVAARDDFAVAAAELHYAVARAGPAAAPAEAGSRPLPLGGLGTPRARGEARLELGPLALRPGDVVAYRVKVLDNRPAELGGPGVGWTAERAVTIAETAEPLANRRGAAERSAIQEQLDAIKGLAAADRQATEPLRYNADAARRKPEAWDAAKSQAVRDREAATREVADRLQLLARDLAAHPRFAPLARVAQGVAEVEAETARDALARAAQAEEPDPRFESLRAADAALGAVVARLDEIQRRFDELGKLDEDRRRLGALADRQDALARRAEEIARDPAGPLDRARLDQAAAEQAKLARELDEVLRRSPQLRAEALAAQQKDADDLAKLARALADRQRDEARRTADPAPRAAALRELAAQQRALEADARRLALRVDEPLAQNERGRLNAGALDQAAAALERVDLEAARRGLEGAEAELRRLARDVEDVRDDPKALARRLLRRQEALREDIRAAVREHVPDPSKPTDAETKALAAALAPLRDRQGAIAALAAAVPVPKDRLDARRQAVERQEAAVAALRKPDAPRELDGRQDEARNLLRQLADAVPDANARRQRQRQAIEDARRRTAEVIRDVERHVRETGPRPNQPYDAPRAAAELAERLAEPARKQAEVAADLDALDVDGRLEPQRRAAARRAWALADALARGRRDALPVLSRDARVGADRLAQAHDRQTTPDTVAAEIAAELEALAEATDPGADPVAEAPRLLAGLRALDVPDAEPARAEAARAVAKLAAPDAKPDDRPAAARAAAEAARTLARRLAGDLDPREGVRLLERAERALDADADRDPAATATAQRAIAEELAAAPAGDRPEARAAAEAVARAVERAERRARPGADADPEAPTPEAAAEARAAAADAMAALAGRIPPGDAAPRPDAPAPAPAPADPAGTKGRARELARRQRELADALQRVHDEAQREPDRNAALAGLPGRLAPLAGRQEALAAEAALLTDARPAGRDDRRDAGRKQAAAGVSQGRALAAMGRREADRAAGLAREAATGLEQFADALPDRAPEPDPLAAAVPDDPGLDLAPERAGEATALARRQRALRERVQSLLADRIQPQRALRAESAALARRAAAIGQAAAESSPRARNAAAQAENLLDQQAPGAMDQAAAQLGQGQADPARDSQRRAAEALDRAADQAEDLAAAIRADTPPEGAAPPEGARLGDARQSQRDAARQLARAREQSGATAQAARSMQQAAAALRAAAEAGAAAEANALARAEAEGPPPAGPGDPDAPDEAANPTPESGPAGTAEAELARLQEALRARTGRTWGELPGHLRTEILTLAQGRYRDDYARLIQLYFREIARTTPDPTPAPPTPR
jgi:hypothetical protein